jgi:cytochrome c-type biogenesis protein CcmH/NrfG
LQLYPDSAQIRASVLSELAEVELKHSQFPDAAAHLRQALQIAPQMPNYHALLAQALIHEGRNDEADAEMRLEVVNRQRAAQEQPSRKE